MMKILVFGADGFIGRSVCDGLSSKHDVVRASRRTSDQGVGSVYADLLIRSSIHEAIRQTRPDTIINCAGVVDARTDVSHNVTFTENILNEAAAIGGVNRVIITGSAGEYGHVSPSNIPVTEEVPLNAVAGYGLAKLEEEKLAISLGRKYSIGVVVLRLFNPIGRNMADKFLLTRLLKQVNEFRLGERDEIELSRLDAMRDYVAIEDVVAAYEAVVVGDPRHDAYNVGSGNGTTNGELLEIILKHSKLDGRPIIRETSSEPEPLVAVQADVTRLSTDLDWRPRRTISDTVREIVDEKNAR